MRQSLGRYGCRRGSRCQRACCSSSGSHRAAATETMDSWCGRRSARSLTTPICRRPASGAGCATLKSRNWSSASPTPGRTERRAATAIGSRSGRFSTTRPRVRWKPSPPVNLTGGTPPDPRGPPSIAAVGAPFHLVAGAVKDNMKNNMKSLGTDSLKRMNWTSACRRYHQRIRHRPTSLLSWQRNGRSAKR